MGCVLNRASRNSSVNRVAEPGDTREEDMARNKKSVDVSEAYRVVPLATSSRSIAV